MIDAYASSERYLRHLLPVWEALPESERGTLYLGGRLAWSPATWGLAARPYGGVFQHPGPRVLVASQNDYRQVTTGRRVVYMNHGAGQSYGGDTDPAVSRANAYAGGDGQERTDLFLVPGPHPAARCRARYPDVPVVEIGCPALDSWLDRPPLAPTDRPVIAIAFQRATRHGDYPLCPEQISALPHYLSTLPALVQRFEVLGHGHPRAKMGLEAVYGPLGIPWTDYETVMLRADVLCVDNSSVGFEAAAVGIPVIWLNAPWYRRDVEHGLRFWGATGVGTEVDEPADLIPAIEAALTLRRGWYGPGDTERRMLREVYSYLDRRCAQRAAAAIVALDDAGRAQEMLAGVTP